MPFLAGDIGGTKTHLVIFEPSEKGPIRLSEKTFPSQKYPSLEAIASEFLKDSSEKPTHACFGVAGPVEGGKCHTTNLPWIVDVHLLEQALAIKRAFLINDLEANAYGIQVLPERDFFLLNPGTPQKGNAALISAGTGLGEAGLYYDGSTLHPFACEGGHCDFAPTAPLELELFTHLRERFEHVSYERVLSGPGLYNIYRFLIDTKKVAKPSEEIKNEQEGPKLISERGLSGECTACVESLKLFTSIYGSEAGNLALKMLAFGGVYIGGGIAPKLLPIIKQGHFFSAFKAKGRFATLLEKMPIRLVLNENTALLGAMHYIERK